MRGVNLLSFTGPVLSARNSCNPPTPNIGKIAIANSDAGASAYTDVAIDQAYRAIQEVATNGETS